MLSQLLQLATNRLLSFFFLFLAPEVITFAVTSPTSSAAAPSHEAIWSPSSDHVLERRDAKMQTEIEGVMEGV